MDRKETYSDSELYILENEPCEVSDRPYLLHAAYALSCLYELAVPEDSEEGKPWGERVPEKIVQRLAKNIADSFNDAAENGGRVDIWGKSYSIRHKNAYDRAKIQGIFNFPVEDGECVITKDGIVKLGGTNAHTSFSENKSELEENRTFLRKVVMAASTDDGWDALTGIEAAVYCWALWHHDTSSDNLTGFMEKYKDWLEVGKDDLVSCLDKSSSVYGTPHGMYAFSAEKCAEWNKRNGQESPLEEITRDEADDWWYANALKGRFKPLWQE